MLEKLTFDGTVASRVTDRLREDIITRQIDAGRRITIKEISDSYGVGSMPVREAFRILEGEHLLEMNPYKGATVVRIDRDFARDIYQINCHLEILIAENAMESITPEACDAMHQINERLMALSGQDELVRSGYTRLNGEFHGIIRSFNDNLRANDLFLQQHNLIHAMRKVYVQSGQRIALATEQHERIIHALRTKNGELLRETTRQHSYSAMEDFIEQYSRG